MRLMKTRRTAVFQALFVVFLWATSWILIKVGLHEIPPLTFAGLRYSLAFACLLPALILQRKVIRPAAPVPRPNRAWGRLILLGLLLYAATQGASFVALAYLPAVTVNLLWSFSSITVALLGIAWLSERPTRFQWAGVGLATLGALLYFYPAAFPREQAAGVVVALFGVLANATSAILGREVNRSGIFHPLEVTGISMGSGSIVLLATGILLEGWPTIDGMGWAIIAWLAVVNTAFAFTLWNHTLRTLPAVESSIINGSMLIWIPLLAVTFLGETITVKQGVGLFGAGLGTLIVQLRHAPAITYRWKA